MPNDNQWCMSIDELQNDGRITAAGILDAVINLKQLVFEVTDACNLRCRYCAYGDLYFGYDNREARHLSFDKSKVLLDYLSKIWREHIPSSLTPHTFISFYGGEPLLNISLVKQIVQYIQRMDINRSFSFSMTTNGMLLDRHMDYLAENKFHVLVSLDGDEVGNGYRVTPSGGSSFGRVFKNVKLLQEKYPEYFEEFVNFNAVLHSLNSVEKTCDFIKKEFNKVPTISELNSSNIKEDKVAEFNQMFRSKSQSLSESTDKESLAERLFLSNPDTNELALFIHQYSGNVYRDYNDLLCNPAKTHRCPTGTCLPFSKKMFVTVNGKILPCEKISQEYVLGTVGPEGVQLDYEQIAATHNNYLDKMQKQCSACFGKKGCMQCFYYVNGIEKNNPSCQGFMNKTQFQEYVHRNLIYLKNHPDMYDTILNEVNVD